MLREELIQSIQNVSKKSFEEVALRLFRYQYNHNSVYRRWVDIVGVNPENIRSLDEVPFLPIVAFKNHQVISGSLEPEITYTSSGTTGIMPSQHFVCDRMAYLDTSVSIFNQFYGAVENYCILALLPSYLEREGSSLIDMVDHFINISSYNESGFFLHNHEELKMRLFDCQKKGTPTILFGVSFGLLDFIEKYQFDFSELIVIETGGMKGRKKEMTKSQLHAILTEGFGVEVIHSEYGMTELSSQAYSQRDGIFYPGNTIRILTRELTDPFSLNKSGRSGIIKVVDLANIDSCAFIETEDLGVVYDDGSFELRGRVDTSDIRGCNLMIQDL